MALETTGFNIQGAMPDLSQGYALGGLKPLSFSGGGQSPVAIAPLAGWKVESAHPEQVMQGLGAGLGAIAKGISAAYISKNAEDTRVKERGEDIDLKKAEMANQREIARMHAGTTEASQAETARHNRAMEEAKQNLHDRGFSLGKKTTVLDLPPLDGSKDESYTPLTPEDSDQIQDGHITGGVSPEYIKQTKKEGLHPSTESNQDLDRSVQPKAGSILAPQDGNITMPPVPQPDLSNVPPTLGDLKSPANEGERTYPDSVHSGTRQFANRIPEQEVSEPAFKPVTAEDINWDKLGTLSIVLPNQVQKNLADIKAPTIPAYEKQIKHNYEAIPDEQAQAIYDYAKSRGMKDTELPVLNGIGGGYTEVKWPTAMEVKKAAAFGDLGTERLKQREEFKNIDLFNQSVDKFNTDTQVKQATEKLKPTIEKFFGDLTELTRMGEGYGRRSILDQSLIDQYIRFATGSIPTEAQYNNLTRNRALWDKLQSLYGKNTAASSSSLLTPEERKQMAESMVNVLNQEHEGLNTTIDSKKRLIDKLKNANITEDNKPHHYPILKMEADVKKDLSKAEKDMRTAWGDGKNNQPKDPDAYKEAIKRHADLVQQLEIAKTGIPANFDDLKKYGENVDGTYYPAGWKGRLMYHESPQQPIFITPDGGQQ
jgi:hypothetical protein